MGDRIRMNAISHPRAYMRSLATRDDNTALSAHDKMRLISVKMRVLISSFWNQPE